MKTPIIAFGLAAIFVVWAMAQALDNVGTAQMDRTWDCWEAGITCEFGNIYPIKHEIYLRS